MSPPTFFLPENEETLARAAGHTVTVADAATWSSFSTRQFAGFNAIVFGDPTCQGNPGALSLANATKAVWSPSVSGPMVVIGTDPQFHESQTGVQAEELMTNGINFAASGAQTGLYVTLSCYYFASQRNTPVDFLTGLGDFRVGGQEGCPATVSIVKPQHPVMQGLTNAGLSDWGCSVHEFLLAHPSTFEVLAIGTRPSDSAVLPYIIATRLPGSPAIQPIILKTPLPGGGSWLLTVEAITGNAFDGEVDPFHVNNFALDFLNCENPGCVNRGAGTTLVLAAADGRVASVCINGTCRGKTNGQLSIRGNVVELAHTGGFGTFYEHLQDEPIIQGLRVGQVVVSGTPIGVLGETGDGGAHLHFAVRYGDLRGIDWFNKNVMIFEELKGRIILEGSRLVDYKVRLCAPPAVPSLDTTICAFVPSSNEIP